MEETGLDGRDVLRVCGLVTEGEVESVLEDLRVDVNEDGLEEECDDGCNEERVLVIERVVGEVAEDG